MMNPPSNSQIFDSNAHNFLGKGALLNVPKTFLSPDKLTSNGVSPDRQSKKIILLVGCDSTTVGLINEALKDKNYEILNVFHTNPACKIAESVKPELVLIGVKSPESVDMDLISQLKENASTYTIPVIFFCEEKPSLDEIDTMLSAGAIDCLSQSIDRSELKMRLKAALVQMNILNSYRAREEKILGEREKLSKDFEKLKAEVDCQRRESMAHLELLIHSKEVKETLLDKIHDLRPYLNPEGKTKLNFIAKQMKWELNDEDELNLERKLDESNYEFYTLLERECPELTKYEKRLCAYFRTNHSAASIARITRKSSNCINVAFARIRSKMNIRNNKELKGFLNQLSAEAEHRPLLQTAG